MTLITKDLHIAGRRTALDIFRFAVFFLLKRKKLQHEWCSSIKQRWARLWSRDRDWDQGGLSLGLKLWDQSIKVSVSVSSFETKRTKSQSQYQNLRLISKVSVSVSNFETSFQKSRSQSQYAKTGLAHHRIFYICEVRLKLNYDFGLKKIILHDRSLIQIAGLLNNDWNKSH